MSRLRPSTRAKAIRAKARELGLSLWGDSGWALAEASMLETPTGYLHLHRINRFGIGKWSITKKSYKGICDTARCRRVYILPLGGEACEVDQESMGTYQESYWRARAALDNSSGFDFIPSWQKEYLMVGGEVIQ